jgi:hypothetical protein
VDMSPLPNGTSTPIMTFDGLCPAGPRGRTERKGTLMFRRRRDNPPIEPRRRQPTEPRRGHDEPPPQPEECPMCYGYGSVPCTYCRESGDRDRGNDIDRDCRMCQGWGAMTCTSCGGGGVRR